jgi:hypothetical protein
MLRQGQGYSSDEEKIRDVCRRCDVLRPCFHGRVECGAQIDVTVGGGSSAFNSVNLVGNLRKPLKKKPARVLLGIRWLQPITSVNSTICCGKQAGFEL